MAKPTTAEALIAKARKIITTKEGNTYRIRRISELELVGALGNIPDMLALADETKGKTPDRVDDPEAYLLAVKRAEKMKDPMFRVVELAMVEPEIGQGGLAVTDLPFSDVAEIFAAALEYLGVNKERGKKLGPGRGTGGS